MSRLRNFPRHGLVAPIQLPTTSKPMTVEPSSRPMVSDMGGREYEFQSRSLHIRPSVLPWNQWAAARVPPATMF